MDFRSSTGVIRGLQVGAHLAQTIARRQANGLQPTKKPRVSGASLLDKSGNWHRIGTRLLHHPFYGFCGSAVAGVAEQVGIDFQRDDRRAMPEPPADTTSMPALIRAEAWQCLRL